MAFESTSVKNSKTCLSGLFFSQLTVNVNIMSDVKKYYLCAETIALTKVFTDWSRHLVESADHCRVLQEKGEIYAVFNY